MKKKIEFIVGIIALLQVISKIVVCPSCDDNFLWFQVSGLVYILIWGFLAGMIFYDVYKENYLKGKEGNKNA